MTNAKRNDWNEWLGMSGCPVPPTTLIEVRFYNGVVTAPREAGSFNWEGRGTSQDIVGYRIARSISLSPILERDIEAYLVKQTKALSGEVRKVQWPGRRNAPDRVVMLPAVQHHATDITKARVDLSPGRVHWAFDWVQPARTIWVEVKNPKTIKTFPANAHERAQAREHERMRAAGQVVAVVGTYEQVDGLLS